MNNLKYITAIVVVSALSTNTSTAHADAFFKLLITQTPAHFTKNIEGAGRESGIGAKILKGATGISNKDIKKHGIKGGPGSFINKPLGTLF